MSIPEERLRGPQHFPVSKQAAKYALREVTGEDVVTDSTTFTTYQDSVHRTSSGFAKGLGLLSRLRAMDHPRHVFHAHGLGAYIFFASIKEHARANMLPMPEVTMADFRTVLLNDVAAVGASTQQMEPIVNRIFSLDERDNEATIAATALSDQMCDKYLAVLHIRDKVEERQYAFLDEEPNFEPELVRRWPAPELLLPLFGAIILGAADCKALLQNALGRTD